MEKNYVKNCDDKEEMPLYYLRRLTGRARTEAANRELAYYLAAIAGAANAGGFLAVRRYTSHMSGVVASMADDTALGRFSLALGGLLAVCSFIAGAILTTLMVRWARRRSLQSEYALPLLLEAILLGVFGATGHVFAGKVVLETVMLLCFTMGLQNAIVTKLSDAVIRTTHVTGMVTDIGIEIGRLLSGSAEDEANTVQADWDRLRLLSALVSLFFTGGVVGALGFKYVGFLFTLPLVLILLMLAIIPVIDDLWHPAMR